MPVMNWPAVDTPVRFVWAKFVGRGFGKGCDLTQSHEFQMRRSVNLHSEMLRRQGGSSLPNFLA